MLARRAALVGQQEVLAEALAAVVAGEDRLPGRGRQRVGAQLREGHLSLRGLGQVGGWTPKWRQGRGLRALEGHVRERLLSCGCWWRSEGDRHLGAQGGSGEAFGLDDQLFVCKKGLRVTPGHPPDSPQLSWVPARRRAGSQQRAETGPPRENSLLNLCGASVWTGRALASVFPWTFGFLVHTLKYSLFLL